MDTPFSGIDRIGALALYDIALRIGAFLGREPELVYLHAGARTGARALGLSCRGRHALAPNEFPKEFARLLPCEIEDCLCIYKIDLAEARDRRSRCFTPG